LEELEEVLGGKEVLERELEEVLEVLEVLVVLERELEEVLGVLEVLRKDPDACPRMRP
jgi:hypothetical protein